MPTPVESLLTTIGIPTEDIASIMAIPEADQATFDPKPFVEKVRTNYQTQFKNDPSFFSDIKLENLAPDVRKQIESGQYARATNVAKEKLAKALGFTVEEIKDLEGDDYKALDFFVPALAEKFAKTKTGDKELQAQLIDARKKLEAFGPEYETGIQQKYEQLANQKIATAISSAAIIGELSAIPGLKISATDLAPMAQTILSSRYAFEREGDYNIALRQKDNPTMKVLKDKTSHELTLKEAIQELATEKGWVDKTPAPGDKGSGRVIIQPNGKGELTMVAPHVQDKIKSKIAQGGQS